MSSHTPYMPSINPTEFDWAINEIGRLEPVLCKNDPVPVEVRTLLSIFCSDKLCNTSKCVYIKEGLKYCLNCTCKNCNNLQEIVNFDDTDEEDI